MMQPKSITIISTGHNLDQQIYNKTIDAKLFSCHFLQRCRKLYSEQNAWIAIVTRITKTFKLVIIITCLRNTKKMGWEEISVIVKAVGIKG